MASGISTGLFTEASDVLLKHDERLSQIESVVASLKQCRCHLQDQSKVIAAVDDIALVKNGLQTLGCRLENGFNDQRKEREDLELQLAELQTTVQRFRTTLSDLSATYDQDRHSANQLKRDFRRFSFSFSTQWTAEASTRMQSLETRIADIEQKELHKIGVLQEVERRHENEKVQALQRRVAILEGAASPQQLQPTVADKEFSSTHNTLTQDLGRAEAAIAMIVETLDEDAITLGEMDSRLELLEEHGSFKQSIPPEIQKKTTLKRAQRRKHRKVRAQRVRQASACVKNENFCLVCDKALVTPSPIPKEWLCRHIGSSGLSVVSMHAKSGQCKNRRRRRRVFRNKKTSAKRIGNATTDHEKARPARQQNPFKDLSGNDIQR